MKMKKDKELDEYFKKYSDNMAIILDYIRYKKDLHNYYQDGYKTYKMLAYIRYSIELALAIKLYGFFDKKHSLTLKDFLDCVKINSFDKNGEFAALEKELEAFEENNVTIKSIIRIRHVMAHVNPTNNPPSLTIEEVEEIVEWIKAFINKLYKLCDKSDFGYLYESETPPIFMDVLDILKKSEDSNGGII